MNSLSFSFIKHLLIYSFWIFIISSLSYGRLKIEGKSLLESNGDRFMIRGVNVAHTWFKKDTKRHLSEVRKLGFNTVRIVLSNGHQWKRDDRKQVQDILDWCQQYQLIGIFEVHDCTGYPDDKNAGTLHQAVEYWMDLKEIFEGTEDRVIINVANEPFGNKAKKQDWLIEHKIAVKKLRASGFKNVLMLDAPNWGQDWSSRMHLFAKEILQLDSQVIFSVHMYEAYKTQTKVERYIKTFANHNFCLVVGEFATSHYGKPVAAQEIMDTCQKYKYGYLAWSWVGNKKELDDLDIIKKDRQNELTDWGALIVHGRNGIAETSRQASCFR